MKSFIEVNKSYKNEGIELSVTCKGSDILRQCFVTWEENVDEKVEALTKEIELEVLGQPINLKDIETIRGCTRDKDLNVIMVAKYLPLNISTQVETKDFEKEHQVRNKLFENLFDLIWEEKLKTREQDDREEFEKP